MRLRKTIDLSAQDVEDVFVVAVLCMCFDFFVVLSHFLVYTLQNFQ